MSRPEVPLAAASPTRRRQSTQRRQSERRASSWRNDPADKARVTGVVVIVGVRQANAAPAFGEDSLVAIARSAEEAGEDVARVSLSARLEFVTVGCDARRINR